MIDLRFLPTRAEFERARSTARAYVVVDGAGLRWVPRPVMAPPRPAQFGTRSAMAWRVLARLQDELEEPPTVRRHNPHVIAERMLAEVRSEIEATWHMWVRS